MRSKYFYVIIAAIIISLFYIGFSQIALPTVIEQEGSFSTAKAMQALKAIADKPRPTGSAQNAEVYIYIAATLESYGLLPEFQEATMMLKGSRKKSSIDIKNIFVTIEGTTSTKPILVNCHYDSVSKSFGAGDDGIGVAVMLETLRLIASSKRMKNSMVFLFNDGEEYNLKGAEAFEAKYPANTFSAVINLEGMNDGPVMIVDTASNSGFLSSLYIQSALDPVAYSALDGLGQAIGLGFDLEVFEKTTPGIGLAPVANMLTYHKAFDNYSNMNQATMYHYGINTVRFIKALGDYDFSKVDKSEQIFFTIARGVVVMYSETFAIISSVIILLIAFSFILYLLIRKSIKLHEVIKSLLVVIGITIFCAFIGAFAGKLFLIFQEKYYGMKIDAEIPLPFFIQYFYQILLSFTLCQIIASFFFLKKLSIKLSATVIQLSVLVLWSVLLSISLFINIKFSYLLSWPILFAVLAMVIYTLQQSHNKNWLFLKIICVVLTTAPVILLFTSFLTILSSGLASFYMLEYFGLLIGMCATFVIAYQVEKLKRV